MAVECPNTLGLGSRAPAVGDCRGHTVIGVEYEALGSVFDVVALVVLADHKERVQNMLHFLTA